MLLLPAAKRSPPPALLKGTKTYTATFSAANGFVTQTKDVDIAATGHDWSNHDGICKVCKTPCGETHQPGTTCPVCHKYTSYPYVPGAPTYPATAPAAPNGTVTVSPANASKGANVTITVKPNEGYELGSLAVKDANGDLLPLADLGNGKFGFVMPASKVSVEANFVKSAVSTGFADVPANAFFADAVKWAVDKGRDERPDRDDVWLSSPARAVRSSPSCGVRPAAPSRRPRSASLTSRPAATTPRPSLGQSRTASRTA